MIYPDDLVVGSLCVNKETKMKCKIDTISITEIKQRLDPKIRAKYRKKHSTPFKIELKKPTVEVKL